MSPRRIPVQDTLQALARDFADSILRAVRQTSLNELRGGPPLGRVPARSIRGRQPTAPRMTRAEARAETIAVLRCTPEQRAQVARLLKRAAEPGSAEEMFAASRVHQQSLWSVGRAGWCARWYSRVEKGIETATVAFMYAQGAAHLLEEEAALARTLDELYASRIYVWVLRRNAGWSAEIRDGSKRFVERTPALPALRLPALVDWLTRTACRAFPDSAYARAHATPSVNGATLPTGEVGEPA